MNKIKDFSNKDKLDLSSDEDLSIAIMNLLSIEEHLFFTAQKTEKMDYFNLLEEVRSIRKDLLKKIIKDYEGEVWCISKHLLASSMRLFEVANKKYSDDKKVALTLYQKAYDLYNVFWAINLKLVPTSGIKKIDSEAIDKNDKIRSPLMSKLSGIIKKIVDCCIE